VLTDQWHLSVLRHHTLPRTRGRFHGSSSKWYSPVLLIVRAISPVSNTLPLPEIEDASSSSSASIHSIPPHLHKEPSLESDTAEKHYRHYLSHTFDDRLTLPLWFPSVIPLGSVGYVRHGQFVKLLDARVPPMNLSEEDVGHGSSSTLPPMSHLDEFGSLQTSSEKVAVRNAAERGLDFVASWTNFVKQNGEAKKWVHLF
jgi:hypothetical protein